MKGIKEGNRKRLSHFIELLAKSSEFISLTSHRYDLTPSLNVCFMNLGIFVSDFILCFAFFFFFFKIVRLGRFGARRKMFFLIFHLFGDFFFFKKKK